MARVVMFMRDELFCGEAKRNQEFRNIVKSFVPFILDGEITYSEYDVSTQLGFDKAFFENPDCELVFTAENNTEAQYQASRRNMLVFEWRCFGGKKLVPVKVNKEEGMIVYNKSHYGIRYCF